VAGEKNLVDDGKIKKKRAIGGGPVVDCWKAKRRRLRI
jgi:hypothetical protein